MAVHGYVSMIAQKWCRLLSCAALLVATSCDAEEQPLGGAQGGALAVPPAFSDLELDAAWTSRGYSTMHDSGGNRFSILATDLGAAFEGFERFCSPHVGVPQCDVIANYRWSAFLENGRLRLTIIHEDGLRAAYRQGAVCVLDEGVWQCSS